MEKSGIDFRDYSFYFLAFIILIILILTYLILKPFLITIITAIILAYIFYPVYKKTLRYIKNKNLNALLISLLIIIILVLPIFLMANYAYKEAYTSYIILKQRLSGGTLFGLECETKETVICRLSNFFSEVTNKPQIKYYLVTSGQKIADYTIEGVSNFIFSLPTIILNFFIMIFVIFFLLRDGNLFFQWLSRLLPLHKLHQQHLFSKFNDVTYGVIYGQILVALIQGILGGIGFLIFGVGSPIFWGAVMAFLALIPYLGPPVVWVPAAILKILEGVSNDSNMTVIKGILLILYGVIIVGSIDNLLRPKLIGDRAKVHPVLVLLGVLGGLKLFGIIGLVVGPVILAILVTFFKIYVEESG